MYMFWRIAVSTVRNQELGWLARRRFGTTESLRLREITSLWKYHDHGRSGPLKSMTKTFSQKSHWLFWSSQCKRILMDPTSRPPRVVWWFCAQNLHLETGERDILMRWRYLKRIARLSLGHLQKPVLPEGRRMNSLCRACWSTWSSTGGHHSSNWSQTQQSFFSGASRDSFPDRAESTSS